MLCECEARLYRRRPFSWTVSEQRDRIFGNLCRVGWSSRSTENSIECHGDYREQLVGIGLDTLLSVYLVTRTRLELFMIAALIDEEGVSLSWSRGRKREWVYR